MKKSFKLTLSGKAELEKELKTLKDSRVAIAERIATARDFGDLSENAEYSAARDEQNITETRILEIEEILKNADIIPDGPKDVVELGATITLDDGKNQQVYSLVGPIEANPMERKISNESPLGKALMGRKVGETAEITTPKGSVQYNIIAIA